MKLTKKHLILFAAALLLLAGLVWMLMPRSLSGVISVEPGSVTNFAAYTSVAGVSEGRPYIDSWTMSSTAPGDRGFDEVLSALNSTGYRPDLRNLFPWPIDAVDGDNGGRMASITLVWGDGKEDYCSIDFLGQRTVCVSLASRDGLLLYHPADPAVLDALSACIQQYGEQN